MENENIRYVKNKSKEILENAVSNDDRFGLLIPIVLILLSKVELTEEEQQQVNSSLVFYNWARQVKEHEAMLIQKLENGEYPDLQFSWPEFNNQ